MGTCIAKKMSALVEHILTQDLEAIGSMFCFN